MVQFKNDCCCCDVPCDSSCTLRHVPHFYCDMCGHEDTLYYFDGSELCLNCIYDLVGQVSENGNICNECGLEDFLYNVYDEKLCPSCFEKTLEKIDIDILMR